MVMISGENKGFSVTSDKYFWKNKPARRFGKTKVNVLSLSWWCW